MKKNVYIFDFDGTLTTRDTLIAFIIYARGWRQLLWGFMLYSPLLLLMKLKIIDNGRQKERMFTYYFKGWTLDRFNNCCQQFAAEHARRLLRAGGLAELRHALAENADVLIVSASIDNWVEPFFKDLNDGRIKVLGTRIEVDGGILTGRFLTANCYGQEKVRRIQEWLTGQREQYYIKAYGDSRGDKEMLEYADEATFKPFR